MPEINISDETTVGQRGREHVQKQRCPDKKSTQSVRPQAAQNMAWPQDSLEEGTSTAMEPCAEAEPQTGTSDNAVSVAAVMPEHEKENSASAQKETTASCRREQPRRNHRKSLSPNHIGDNQRLGRVAQWDVQKEQEVSPGRDASSAVKRTDAGSRHTEKAARKDEELLKFAEILYKCSLCTTLPCILTSQSAFLHHVKKHHLTVQAAGIHCQHCHLHFDTHTDLQVHLSEAHCVPEQESPVTVCESSVKTTQQSEQANSPQPSTCHDHRHKREAEEPITVDGQSDDLTRPAVEQRSSRRSSGEDYTKADVKPQVCVSSRYTPPSTPLATLEYHCSVQHLQRLHALTSGPPLSPPQQADPSRSPLFAGSVPELFNGVPSFTPEFGRYTKLIREGGRIVYFCQVCNVKCQVKAAFQVHCNGVRHHNTVNMAGKNKAHLSPPLPSPREACVRSPLKEVPLMTPQLAAPRGDHSFIEKVNKFFQDYPDLSPIVNNGNSLTPADFWGSPVNFTLKDRCGEKSDSEESKQSEKEIKCPDKRQTIDRNFCLESRDMSPNYQQECNLKKRLNEQCMANTRVKSGAENTGVSRLFENADNRAGDTTHARSRKRLALCTPCSNPSLETGPQSSTSPVSSVKSVGKFMGGDTDSAVVDRDTSSEPLSSKRPRMDSGQIYSLHEDTHKSSAEARLHGDSSVATEHFAPDTEQSKASSSDQHSKEHTESVQQSNKDTEKSLQEKSELEEKSVQKRQNDENHSEAERTTDSVHASSDDDLNDPEPEEGATSHGRVSPSHHHDPRSVTAEQAASLKCRTVGEQGHEKTIPDGTDPRQNSSEAAAGFPPVVSFKTEPDFDSQEHRYERGTTADGKVVPPRSGGTVPSPISVSSHAAGDTHLPDQALLNMLANQQFSVEGGGGCLFSAAGVISDAWFRPGAGPNESDLRPLWGGRGVVSLPSLEDPDDRDVTDSSKGPNSEGWKVTKIRNVLRGLIAASGKSSSVSRDVLLHRVSRVLHVPDAQHWGPACNRAVRDLFPHCLAQRKGKFKKTYFFGLSLTPAVEESKGENLVHVDGTSFRPLRDMTQDLEQLLEHLPGLLYWSGVTERGVSRDCVLHVLANRLSEGEVFHWGMQCNRALRILFPFVLMKRKGKYKTTVYFGVEFTAAARKLLPTLGLPSEQSAWQDMANISC